MEELYQKEKNAGGFGIKIEVMIDSQSDMMVYICDYNLKLSKISIKVLLSLYFGMVDVV